MQEHDNSRGKVKETSLALAKLKNEKKPSPLLVPES